ncbi:hypothetical protein [Streptomyces sp. NPDC001404]|uniref:hypothetical protein n=1 Tax=Streptomyces sp. NPDC001404 TaxID=3364571 RepID=UPI003687014A
MTRRIATVSGTMLTPGVSRNGRLYSPELIAKAAKRMQERIADPAGLPIVMRTHHDAGDDSRLIVGRLTSVRVEEDGSAQYRADLYDTAPGRDIAALVTGTEPALRSVSIHGYWLGPLKRVQHEGETVTTADDLEIDAVDFTAAPGVLGASVTSASYTPDEAPAAESGGRIPISESVQASIKPLDERLAGETYSAKQRRAMAGRGQAMADGSYPIRTRSDLRRAIRAVGRGGADHDAIRRHIIQRATTLGLASMIPATWSKDGSMKESAGLRLGEVREYYPNGPEDEAGFCIDAFNGPISLTMRACGVDPAELRAITQAAMAAAVDALQAMDPDMDADIDVPGAPHADTDGDTASGESAPARPAAAADTVTEALAPAPPTLGAATTTTQEEAAMGEPDTPTTETAATTHRTLTDADISALGVLVGAALKESLEPLQAAIAEQTATPVPQAAESAPAPTSSKPGKKAAAKALKETVRAEIQQLREELRAQVRDELREEILRENGLPPRKGFRVHENDHTGAEPSDEDLFANRADVLLGDFGRTPQPAP